MASVIKLRGLPYKAREEEVVEFLAPIPVSRESVTLITEKRFRTTGEAYVWIHTEDVGEALRRNRGHIGTRYIDVFRSTDNEYYDAVEKMGYSLPRNDASRPVARPKMPVAAPLEPVSSRDFDGSTKLSREQWKPLQVVQPVSTSCTDGVVLLSGIPYLSTAAEIAALYSGSYKIDESMIYVRLHTTGQRMGQFRGEAFARFADAETANTVIMKSNQLELGGRLVEITPSSEKELSACAEAGGIVGYESNNPLLAEGQSTANSENTLENIPGSGWLRLRGLPYKATKIHLMDFMTIAGLTVPAKDTAIKVGPEGAHTGEAFVRVESLQVAEKAAKVLDRQAISGRYIEVFLCSYQDTQGSRARVSRPNPYASRFANLRALKSSRN